MPCGKGSLKHGWLYEPAANGVSGLHSQAWFFYFVATLDLEVG
jgi:hypothetical protein